MYITLKMTTTPQFAVICRGRWAKGEQGDVLPYDTILALMVDSDNERVKGACMSLIDALVTAPASVIQRAWTVKILNELDLESIMEDLRAEHRDDDVLMLLCSQVSLNRVLLVVKILLQINQARTHSESNILTV